MADNTLSSRSNPRPYRVGVGTWQMKYFEESTCVSTATIRYGDIVGFDCNVSSANHRVVKCSTQAAAGVTLSTGTWIGLGAEDSTSDGSTTNIGVNKKIGVYVATANSEFWMVTKSSAVTSTCLNTRRAVGYDSTLGIFYCNIANSTAGDAMVIITDIPNPGTDANNPVIVKFMSSALARIIAT